MKTSSTHGENRYPGLLQTWIRDNAELKPYIRMKSWYLLVQFLLRSLKSDNSAEIDKFISDLFPNLFRDEVPYFLAAQGLTSLRSSMLSYIMEEQKRRGARETDEQILKIISIFDRVFRYLNTQIRQYSEPKNDTVIEILDGESPENRPNLMVLRVDGRRFEGTVRMDRQLKQFLGLTERRLLTSVNWDLFIHPDDMPDALTAWRDSVENRSPVYELGYRLKHSDGNWRSVLEIGRILYSSDGKPIAGVTVLMESNTAEALGQLPPDYLLRYLIDSRKDMTLLVDQNAQTLYATPLLVQQIAQPDKPANGTLPKNIAVLRNESDRKITAVNFWEILAQSQSAGKHRKTIQIKIQNDSREQDKTLDFRLIKLAKIFGKPVYLLWATEISVQKDDSGLAGRLADLHRFSAELKSQ
ncbi:MAG: PAS domain-containing protein, partial [Calditrichaeota bacterium]|nr:PAS domain-containing protein [Calditrichota bacterium]